MERVWLVRILWAVHHRGHLPHAPSPSPHFPPSSPSPPHFSAPSPPHSPSSTPHRPPDCRVWVKQAILDGSSTAGGMSGMGWVGLPDGVRYRTLYGASNKCDDDVGTRWQRLSIKQQWLWDDPWSLLRSEQTRTLWHFDTQIHTLTFRFTQSHTSTLKFTHFSTQLHNHTFTHFQIHTITLKHSDLKHNHTLAQPHKDCILITQGYKLGLAFALLPWFVLGLYGHVC